MTAWDEMVDGRGGIRPQWRRVLSTIAGMEPGALANRAQRLERAAEDDGASSDWRCDPVPLPLTATEFATLERGLIQRARLLEAVLADLYGPQHVLSEGVLPPALVYANPDFLRPCREGALPPPPLLHVYAADLVRSPDGQWRVLADRTRAAFGVGYARTTRQLLARVVPELFRFSPIRPLRPFFEAWQDALVRLAGPQDGRAPSIAMLTPGVDDAHWPEHAGLSRELGCPLVETRDLAVRNGAVFVKTLDGLRPVDLLLRRVAATGLDPLEQPGAAPGGVMGLLEAVRRGTVRILNHPGAGILEMPALAAFMPSLCRTLLGEPLRLATLPSLWLADDGAKRTIAADFQRWAVRPAFDVAAPPQPLAGLTREARIALEESLSAAPWGWVGCTVVPPSRAPCLGAAGSLQAEPIVLRLFLLHDGNGWRMMPGGIARVLPPGAHAGEAFPADGVFKDVWVVAEESADIADSAPAPLPAMTVRRSGGDMPSRVAEDFYALGRHVERLQGQARLARCGLLRLGRAGALPREAAEVEMLRTCLGRADMADDGAGFEEAVGDALAPGGALCRGLEAVSRLTAALRDRLTTETLGAFLHALRAAAEPAAEGLDGKLHAMASVQRLATTVAGTVADGMVEGGGRRFLDLGRRIERAIGTSLSLAAILDQPSGRQEPALLLALELCDSVLTYRGRYQAAVQKLPVLDLIMADTGNPRALACQFALASTLLDAAGDRALAGAAADLQARAGAIAMQPHDYGPPLLLLARAAASLSERISRRFFAHAPAAREVGLEIA